MADIRIKDLATTASTTASDDFLAVDGTTNGTRKLSAATPSFATSVTVPGVAGPTATNLTLTGGSTGASLVLGQGASGNATLALKTSARFNLTAPASNDAYIEYVGNAGTAGTTSVVVGQSGAGLGVIYNRSNSALTLGTNSLERGRFTETGNLLIGGTTDIPGSGGLKVFGTTAASSTTTGALQVAGGVGVVGAGYFGGTVTSTGNITAPDLILGTSGPSAKSSIAARAARQGLVFDGTSNATLSVAGPGTGDFTHAIIVKTTQTSRAFTSGAPTAIVSLWVSSGGFAQVRNDGVAILLTGTKTINDGKSHYIVASRTGGTLFLYVDGVLDASVADSTNFSTATTYIGKDYSAGILLTGSVTPAGFYNRALSAAEVVSLYEAGVPAGVDYNTASNTNAITTIARNSDFSAGATDWTGSSATATVTASKLDIVISTSGSRVYLDKTFITGWTAGYNKRWRLTADITNYSVSGGAVVQIVQGTTGTVSGTISGNGTFSVELTNTNGNVANGQEIQIRNTGTTGTATLTIDNVVIVPLGLLLAPDAAQSGGGLTWYDTSGNAANITLPATGVSWNVPTSGKAFSLSLASTTAGSAGAGALVVSGGLATGAASYFGGAVSVSVANPEVSIRSASDAAAQRQYLTFGSPNYNRAQFQGVSAGTNDGSLELRTFNAGVQTLSQTWNKDGSSTFSGAVAIGNTVNTVSPTSPNRTVTMVIGGVTYYLAAKTTND
jgi:hypothetical protein